MPTVSVIIPAYNAERWLPETLASVAEQGMDGESMEVIIVDDGSQDDTSGLVSRIWPQYRLVRTANHGVSHARNLGTSLATGEFIQYLDADDVLLPGKITRHLTLLKEHRDSDIVYSNWQRLKLDTDGRFVHAEKVLRRIEDVHANPELAFFNTFWCPTAAYFYRRGFLEKVLPWKEWLPVIQDARLALDCAMAGARWLHDPAISVLYRQHSEGSISTRSKKAFLNDCVANVDDVCRLWQSRQSLDEAYLEAVKSAYLGLASSSYDLDRALFHRIHHSLKELDPSFMPHGWKRILLTHLLGFEAAEATASMLRKLRRHRPSQVH